jgi:gliding motility-associated protein GldL
MAEMTEATQRYLDQIAGISEQMAQLRENTQALNDVSTTLLGSYRAITDNSETISQGSTGYVEQMEALNRNIGGLNTIYEIQLKSISSQLDNIDRVNRGLKDIRDMYEKSAAESADYCNETERLAHNMKQLNSVYEKMVKALTVNMYRPMGSFETDEDNLSAAEQYRRRTANQNDDNA